MFILVFILIAVVAGIGFLIVKANFNIDMEMLNEFMNKFGLFLLVLFMIVMYYVSYKISCKIYMNKEE